MRFLDATTYTADKAWDALDIAEIDHATVRLHWIDKALRRGSPEAERMEVIPNSPQLEGQLPPWLSTSTP